MSLDLGLSGKVGKWEFSWKSVPRGGSGVAQVEVKGEGMPARLLEFRWKRDADGLWLELPDGVHGFDVQGEPGDDGRLEFRVEERGGPAFWSGLTYLQAGEEQVGAGAAGAKKGVRVRAQMPGKILRIHVKPGDSVEKGQALLVMEAMKMENEIRAAQAGTVGQVKVTEGQAVETGAELCTLE